MTQLIERRSIVGIDVTTKGLAYIFFEDGRLIDWENLRRGDDGEDLALFDRVVDGCAADIVLLEDPDANGCRLGARAQSVARAMARHARVRGVRLVLVSRAEVRASWFARGATNKQEIASAIGVMFPEFAPLVPPPRRIFDREAERMNLFDALALVLHRYGHPELVR